MPERCLTCACGRMNPSIAVTPTTPCETCRRGHCAEATSMWFSASQKFANGNTYIHYIRDPGWVNVPRLGTFRRSALGFAFWNKTFHPWCMLSERRFHAYVAYPRQRTPAFFGEHSARPPLYRPHVSSLVATIDHVVFVPTNRARSWTNYRESYT